jgi:outer membrane cobalamin receptor
MERGGSHWLPPLFTASGPEVAMRRFVAVLAVLLAVTASGCTRPPKPAGSVSGVRVISRDDMDRIHAATALDAVQRYRADVLVTRAPSSVYLNKQQHPVVFIDSQFWGQVDELRNIGADGIKEIRFFDGTDAVRLFGAQYGGGVIQIVSRDG